MIGTIESACDSLCSIALCGFSVQQANWRRVLKQSDVSPWTSLCAALISCSGNQDPTIRFEIENCLTVLCYAVLMKRNETAREEDIVVVLVVASISISTYQDEIGASSSRFYIWRRGILVQRWRYFYYKHNWWQGNSIITVSDTICTSSKRITSDDGYGSHRVWRCTSSSCLWISIEWSQWVGWNV